MLRDPVLGPLISVLIIVMGVVTLGHMTTPAGIGFAWLQIILGTARLGLQIWWRVHAR